MANQFGAGYIVQSGGADNLSADLTSKIVNIEGSEGVGVEIKLDNTVLGTKTAAGNIEIQVSNSGVNWTAVELSSGLTYIAASAGVDVSAFCDLNGLNAKFLRIFYDRTSGNGVLDVWTYVRRS